jgi:hypothetical protein
MIDVDAIVSRARIESINMTLNEFIGVMKRVFDTKIPEKNKKTFYTKACWLLAKYQQLNKIEFHQLYQYNIDFLKKELPVYRKLGI